MPSIPGPLLRRLVAYTALTLGLTLSFWVSPGPRTEAEYCGTYLHLTSWAGFTANCDGFVYMDNARQPARLLQPRAVRQSRPLFILLGSAVGYPCTWVVRGLERSGLLPARVVQKLPAKYQPLLGFYIGYVLLNYAVLLAALLLFRHLYYRLAGPAAHPMVLAALLVFLVSNQVTKAFFWTVHQQMFTFLVPLVLVYLARQLPRAAWQRRLPALAVAGGVLSLVYGSFVLVLPVLWQGMARQRGGKARLAARLLGLTLLFAAPTLLWIGILKLQGVTYYNHEAEAYGQVVWLRNLWNLPPAAAVQLLAGKLAAFFGTLPAISGFLAAATVAVGLSWRKAGGLGPELRPLLGVGLLLLVFLAGLGYYKERLTWLLVPVLLLLLGTAAGPRLATPRWRVALLLLAGAWHVAQVLAYGPFS